MRACAECGTEFRPASEGRRGGRQVLCSPECRRERKRQWQRRRAKLLKEAGRCRGCKLALDRQGARCVACQAAFRGRYGGAYARDAQRRRREKLKAKRL